MLLHIPDVLTADEVASARQRLDAADLDRRPRHRRPPVRAGQGQPAAARRLTRSRGELGDEILARAAAQSAVHLRRAAAARLSAAVQPLPGRPVVRQPRRQRDPPGRRHAAPHPHRSVGDAVLQPSPDEYDGGELVVEDTYGVHAVKLPAGHLVLYPVDQPAPRAAGDARRARRVVLLDPEHGARRRRAHAAVRSGLGDPAA